MTARWDEDCKWLCLSMLDDVRRYCERKLLFKNFQLLAAVELFFFAFKYVVNSRTANTQETIAFFEEQLLRYAVEVKTIFAFFKIFLEHNNTATISNSIRPKVSKYLASKKVTNCWNFSNASFYHTCLYCGPLRPIIQQWRSGSLRMSCLWKRKNNENNERKKYILFKIKRVKNLINRKVNTF